MVRHRANRTDRPLLLSFNKLGFDPEYTYYSDRPGTTHHRYHAESPTPKVLIIVVVIVLAYLGCIACNRVTRLMSSEAPSPEREDSSTPSASPGSSRTGSPRGSPELTRRMDAGMQMVVNRSTDLFISIEAKNAAARRVCDLHDTMAHTPRPPTSAAVAKPNGALVNGIPSPAGRARIDPTSAHMQDLL